MDPQMQTTFIPRKPTVPAFPVSENQKRLDPILSVSIILFVWSLVFVGIVFGSRLYIGSAIASGTEDLKKLENTFDKNGYEKVRTISQKLHLMDSILSSTVSLDMLFVFLEDNLLKNITISNMALEMSAKGPSLTFTAEASGFNALAKQTATFNTNKAVLSYEASNISLTDTGKISFSGKLILDQKLLVPTSSQ